MAVLKTVLMKSQTTPSTVTLVNTDAMKSFGATLSMETDKLTRNLDKSYLGADPEQIIGKRVKIEIEWEMMGAAVAGASAPIAPLLETSGMQELLIPADVGPPVVTAKARYNFTTNSHKYAYFYFFWGDGSATDLLFRVKAAKASTTTSIKSKEYWKAKSTYIGELEALPIEQLPTTGIVYTGFQDAPPATTEKAELKFRPFGAVTPYVPLRCYQFDTADGHEVAQTEDFKVRDTRIDARKFNGQLYIVKEDFSIINPWAIADSQAAIEIICETVDGPGRIARAFVAKARLDFPQLTEFNKRPAYQIAWTGLPITGNDEGFYEFE